MGTRTTGTLDHNNNLGLRARPQPQHPLTARQAVKPQLQSSQRSLVIRHPIGNHLQGALATHHSLPRLDRKFSISVRKVPQPPKSGSQGVAAFGRDTAVPVASSPAKPPAKARPKPPGPKSADTLADRIRNLPPPPPGVAPSPPPLPPPSYPPPSDNIPPPTNSSAAIS